MWRSTDSSDTVDASSINRGTGGVRQRVVVSANRVRSTSAQVPASRIGSMARSMALENAAILGGLSRSPSSVAVITSAGDAGGMSPALRPSSERPCITASTSTRACGPNGFRGLHDGTIQEMDWMSVNGLVWTGGAGWEPTAGSRPRPTSHRSPSTSRGTASTPC